MIGSLVMLKANLKLILRNKASIFLIFLIPLVSTLILKIPLNRDDSDRDNSKLRITIFNNSSSEVSMDLISFLESSNSFRIAIETNTASDVKSAQKQALNLANKSTTNGFVYIPSNLSESILDGRIQNVITLFSTGKDERIKLLDYNINTFLSKCSMYSKAAQGHEEVFNELIKNSKTIKTVGEEINVASAEKELSSKQNAEIANLGYLIAIMSITLMFSGNFVASIFVEEKNNRILKRITLTNSSMLNYAMVKAIVSLAVLIIQVCMIAIGIKLFVTVNVGINLMQIALLVFGLGIVFNTLSIALGALLQNLSNANYLAFFIATLSAMMSGLYFPLEVTPQWMQNAALLMPQRWVVKTAEHLLLGANQWLALFGVVVLGYVALFLTIGLLGLKLNK